MSRSSTKITSFEWSLVSFVLGGHMLSRMLGHVVCHLFPLLNRRHVTRLLLLTLNQICGLVFALGCSYYEFVFDTPTDKRKVWSFFTMSISRTILVSLHMFEILSGVQLATPLTIDEATQKWAFGHYAHILVNFDLSKRIFWDFSRMNECAFYEHSLWALIWFLHQLFYHWSPVITM
jgi:hypothetical protein